MGSLHTINDWLVCIEKWHDVGTVFFDFTKAFNSVHHLTLLAKLRHIGLSQDLISWIHNYLLERSQCIVVNGATSQRVPVLSGVPQGSVLGLLLFPICMDDLASLTLSSGSRLTLYADDILLYKPITFQADYESLQNHGLTRTMSLNPSKCKHNPGKEARHYHYTLEIQIQKLSKCLFYI